ncbi:MAG: hypothetical protein HRU25_04700 [Psychrobium sp.]|nr:hypothetical protein [Psychrobium sp.]
MNNQRQLFILTCAIVLLLSLSLPVYATQYNGCSDPQYISYVAKRIAFYDKLDRERYEKEKSALTVPFENLSYIANKIYLFSNTVASARFDTPQVALRHINAYQSTQMPIFRSGDIIHRTNIAKAWLAMTANDLDKTINLLMASTKTSGSAVLKSFGPDVTIIRELYQRGKSAPVIDYLNAVQQFWPRDSSHEIISVWRKLISKNCPIQFHFYDTTSIKALALD